MTPKRVPPSWTPEYKRAYYHANREEILAKRRARYAGDAALREATREAARAYRVANAESVRESERRRNAASLVNRTKSHIGACVSCGYDRHIGALQWAHQHAEEKLAEPSALRRNHAAALNELPKCALLCANCHWEQTHGLWSIADWMVDVTRQALAELGQAVAV